MKNRRIRYCWLVTLPIALLASQIIAGPPTGPRKNDCNAAIVATLIQQIDFGEFNGGTGGTVSVSTSGVRTATGGVILTGGTSQAAIFEVDSTLPGCEVYPLRIRAPNTATLTEPGGTTMAAANFVTLPVGPITLVPGIPQLIYVGADLTVAAGQVGGTYDTLAPYSLTLRY